MNRHRCGWETAPTGAMKVSVYLGLTVERLTRLVRWFIIGKLDAESPIHRDRRD